MHEHPETFSKPSNGNGIELAWRGWRGRLQGWLGITVVMAVFVGAMGYGCYEYVKLYRVSGTVLPEILLNLQQSNQYLVRVNERLGNLEDSRSHMITMERYLLDHRTALSQALMELEKSNLIAVQQAKFLQALVRKPRMGYETGDWMPVVATETGRP